MSQQPKWTPGPWTFGRVLDEPVVFAGAYGPICRPYVNPDKGLEEAGANARLIAAAPEMVEALQQINAMLDERIINASGKRSISDALKTSEAALRKAGAL